MTRQDACPLLSALMLGVACQLGQVLLLRELLMVFHGNELAIGLVFAAWLVWVGIGSRLGAIVAERTPRPLFALVLAAAGILFILPTMLLLVRGVRGVFDVVPGTLLSLTEMALSCFLLPAPACGLLGAHFVLLSRVWRESSRAEDTSGAGKAYAGEAAGNMLGGLMFTFLLVHTLGTLQCAVLAGMLPLCAALIAAAKLDGSDGAVCRNLRRSLWLLLALAAASLPFLQTVDDWACRQQWRQFMPLHRLIETRPSKHGMLAVLQRDDQYSFFQSGHFIFAAAGKETVRPGLEEQEAATFAHFAMVQHQDPKRVLLIGGGLRGTLTEMIKHPVEMVDYVEMDPALTAMARTYVPRTMLRTLADRRVRLIHTDGRLFVKTAQGNYDMIIVDVPDPSTAVLNRFYTLEFFREVGTLLEPDGVLIVGATSTPDLMGLPIANRNATLYHTLDSVFEHVIVGGDRSLFYLASQASGQASVDVPTLQRRYRARKIESDGFSEHHFAVLLRDAQLRRVNWIVRHHGRRANAHLTGPARPPLTPETIETQQRLKNEWPPVARRTFINSDFRPIGYYYTVMVWDEFTRSGQGKTFQRLLRADPWWLLPLICLPLAATLGLRGIARSAGSKADTRFAVRFAVFTTGFSTMALQIALLFAFQGIYGFVYEMVGLIVAIFMGGLALGTLLVQRYVTDKANLHTLTVVQLLIALLAGFIALSLPGTGAVTSPNVVFVLFSALTFLAGLINGVDFPLATACCMALNRRAEKSTGDVYAIELFGACVGAAAASVVVAPLFGIVACCLLAGAVNAAACAALLISRRKHV